MPNALTVAQGNSANASIIEEGTTVLMTNFYPSQASGGIDAAVRFDSATFSTTGTMTFRVTNAPTPAACAFLYTAAASTTQPATIGTAATTGC